MIEKPAILVIDDETGHADVVAEALRQTGADTLAVYNARNAIELLESRFFDVVVTDLNLNDDKINGIDILKAAKRHDPYSQVILITAYATIDTCKEAIRAGAFDYLVKPIDIDHLRAMAEKAMKKLSVVSAAALDKNGFNFEGVVGKSPAMQSVVAVLRRVAPTNITVLIEGESGTGKELLAQMIHENSPRRDRPFIAVACGAIPETLVESELFGHERGAFTGADSQKEGKFEQAQGGSLFLDEIANFSENVQVKLLRALQERRIQHIGEKGVSMLM